MVLRCLLCILLFASVASAATRPVVVELYTSQGCSSCPAADALLKKLAADPSIIALSFHVHYWDNLGWKDPFSSELNTARQRAYQQILNLDSVFTPQVIVDGHISTVGSDEKAVTAAIAQAKNEVKNVPVTIKPDADGANLIIDIAPQTPPDAVAWEIHFNRSALTPVSAGENGGSMLENTNNVMRFMHMDLKAGKENKYQLALQDIPEDAVAVIVQDGPTGRVIGAASYIK